MADRVKPMGMDRALTSKMGAKYDPDAEREVRHWFQQILGEDIGEGPNAVEKNLRNGVILVKLMQKLFSGTSDLPPAAAKIKEPKYSTLDTPFKQMENIEIFLKCARAYGVPLVSCFQTVDLYEGRNVPMVIATILQVGTEAQRNGFSGETAGPKPSEKVKRNFTYEQLKSSQGTIGLQAGSNKFASQKGMRIGSVRHISDIRADKFSKDSEGVLTLQAGTNKFDSQKGTRGFGAVRHISDIRADDFSQASEGVITLQAGTNKFDSQKGTRGFGAVRHISDVKVEELDRAGTAVVRPDMGYSGGDSQKGMTCFGAHRHVSDIKVLDLAENFRQSQGISKTPSSRAMAEIDEPQEEEEQ